ncbi:MAG: hypothetical protein K9N23_08515 [Akkermansiaceae bacterium]|nr:hypothetical protein [Akkermansiaceae bacterium]
MKRRTRPRPRFNLPPFDPALFVREIDLALPSIDCPDKRAAVEGARHFLVSFALPNPFLTVPPTPAEFAEVAVAMIETLRCCGIAPAGWPRPPEPGAVIRCRKGTPQELYFATDGKGGAL